MSYVLDELWADPGCRVVKVDKGPSTAPFAADIIGQTARFRRALAAL